MKRLAYYPIVDKAEQLTDIVSRAAWFLTFSPIESVSIFLSDPSLADADWTVAPGMDPAIRDRFPTLRRLVEFVPVSEPADVQRHLRRAELVLRWKHEDSAGPIPRTTPQRWLGGKQIVEVDPERDRHEGGNYIDVSFRLDRSASMNARHREAFSALTRDLGTFERAFVMATGPSVGAYRNFEYDGSLGVVCNTVIRDEELMETVKPKFVVFLDPIFHFGPSRYAATFRSSLRQAAEQFDFTICIATKYYPVFSAAVPELADRTIAVPFRKDREFNFDLRSDFEVRTTANVLTFMMLPLAATFAPRVGILGCDGRPLNEDRYFWKHNPATQLNEEMANIREVHPGFFDIHYNDYYLEHCETLEEQLEAGERAGRQFESLAPSHIPALGRRASNGRPFSTPRLPAQRSTSESPETGVPRLLVLDATRVNSAYATGQFKGNMLAGWPDERFLQLYAGDRGKPVLARSLADPDDDRRISTSKALDEVAAFRPEVIYYRPTADLHSEVHAVAMEILGRHSVPVVSQIMDDWPARLAEQDAERARDLDRDLRAIFSRSHRALSVSEKMSWVFEERYGVPFEPIANGADVETYRAASAAAARVKSQRETMILRYSGALAADMTFDTVVDVARAVDALQESGAAIRFEVYTWAPWLGRFKKAVAGLNGTGAFESVPRESYPALLAEADALLIGYNFDAKSVGYVGLSMPNKLPECLASGAPILAVGPRSVNGIEYLDSNDLACCVTARDHDRLVEAVRRLAVDVEYRGRLSTRGQAWAFERLDLRRASARFQQVLHEAANKPPPTAGSPAGLPGSRDRTYTRGGVAQTQSAESQEEAAVAPRRSSHAEVGRQPLQGGRLLARWISRGVRRNRGWILIYLLLMAAFIAVAAWPDVGSYGAIGWIAATVLALAAVAVAVAGFANYLVIEARREGEAAQEKLGREQERLSGEQGKVTRQLESRIKQADSEIDELRRRAVSLDIVSVLRHLSSLWAGEDGLDDEETARVGNEHGHALLMRVLVEEARNKLQTLRGKTLIEVGSTRELDDFQGSTEKLAIFTALTGMRFISVDADPQNTAAARRVLRYLNADAEAVTARGENYLAESSGPFDYVYLDAFDFDHGKHSEARHQRYRDVLETEISDEASWEMHRLCAEALVETVPAGGIVVIDDTWVDEDGELDGKGRLAAPLLLANGFSVVAQTPRTIALKRMAGR